MIDTVRAASLATLALGLVASAGGDAVAAQCGRASWYKMGTKTANGEPMRPLALTAAHRSLPFGAQLRVTNKSNGKSVVVRVNDRGPFAKDRLLDVSESAAGAIGMKDAGDASVCFAQL
jgi:rare lipoprotein A